MTRSTTLSLDGLLRAAIRRHADRPALSGAEQWWTYQDLERAVEAFAHRLAQERVNAGERVAIVAPNQPATVVALLAVWRVGAVAVPLSPRWRAYELSRALRDAEPSLIMSPRVHGGFSFADLLADLAPRVPTARACLFLDPAGKIAGRLAGPAAADAERCDADTGLILYTSGSTGEPKGALVGQAGQVEGAEHLNAIVGALETDVCGLVTPIAHAFGFQCWVAALAAGCRVHLLEPSATVEPTLLALRQERVSLLHGSPTLFAALLQSAPEGLPSVRRGFVAGAPCPPELLAAYDRLGTRLLNLYGMTELGAITCARPADPPTVRHRTVGRPLPHFEVRAVGPAGEVEARGRLTTPGYWRRPCDAADFGEEGWFRTGDLGAVDAAGNLTILGRARDLVKVGGLAVFPAEVEGLLLSHPDVAQAAVVGMPQRLMGEALQAFVVRRPGARLSAADLLRFARARIASYKLPYTITFVPELPLLASGKPDRRALQHLAREAGHGAE